MALEALGWLDVGGTSLWNVAEGGWSAGNCPGSWKFPHPHPWGLGHPSRVIPLMLWSWKSRKRGCHHLWIRAGITWNVPNPGKSVHRQEKSSIPPGQPLLDSHGNLQRDLNGISLQILGFKPHLEQLILGMTDPGWDTRTIPKLGKQLDRDPEGILLLPTAGMTGFFGNKHPGASKQSPSVCSHLEFPQKAPCRDEEVGAR